MMRMTRAQSRRVDELALDRFKIPLIVLMENAARSATIVALEMIHLNGGPAMGILCGPGNNGGDGLAIARHLYNHGIGVALWFLSDVLPGGIEALDAAKYHSGSHPSPAAINFEIARAMQLPMAIAEPVKLRASRPCLWIDAMFGTGLTSQPRDPFAQVLAAVEQTGIPVLAIDIPSGLDCDSGLPMGLAVRATRTITFVAEKVGFCNPAAAEYVGAVTVGDIGIPPELIEMACRKVEPAGPIPPRI